MKADILLIDNQPYMGMLLSDELADTAYRLTSVEDGETANQYLEEAIPDLILLDLFVNGLDGWDVLRNIKRRVPDVPVLILSAYDSFRDHPRLREADGYVVKNPDLGPLMRSIDEALTSDVAGSTT
jgi:DNA-binding response OmpR family regulator